MIRWLGIVLVLAGSIGLGYYYSARSGQREKTLLLGQQYFRMLRGIISFGAEPLPEALDEMAGRSSPPWNGFFRAAAERMQNREGSFGILWEKEARRQLSAHMSRKDLESLIRAGQNMGYLDKEMQLDYLDMLQRELEESYEQMRRQEPEKRRLYRAWGILGGIFLVIFLL